MKNNKIKIICNNTLKETFFFENLQFDELEWSQFYNRYNKIKYFLRETNFKREFYEKFKMVYNCYSNSFDFNNTDINNNCAICLEDNSNYSNRLIICPKCKNNYHQKCLIKWFEEMNKDKICPICKDTSWKNIIKYVILDCNYKFNINYL